MLRSLYAGVSGLRNHQTRMDVIGNNIANINTFGYKAGRVAFSDIMSQTLQSGSSPTAARGGINPIQVGLGMGVNTVGQRFIQGSIVTTGVTTDLAIQGDAFFIMSNGENQFFTRTNMFQFDGTGRLVDPGTGLVLQGSMADSDGDLLASRTLGDIALPFGQKFPARATTEVDWTGNLDASVDPIETIMQSKGVLSIPEDTDDIFALSDGKGVALDIVQGDQVYFNSLASVGTGVDQLYNGSGTSLGLQLGDTIYASGYVGEISSTTMDKDDFLATTIDFDIDVWDESAEPGFVTYAVSIPALSGESASDGVDKIIDAIKASGAPVEMIDNGSSFTMRPLNQTTHVAIQNGPPLDMPTIGLVGTESVTANFDAIDLSVANGTDNWGGLLIAIEAELDDPGLGNITIEQQDDGSLRILNENVATDITVEIRSATNNSVFANAVADLQGELDATDRTGKSDAFTFQASFVAGDDFATLDDLAEEIENAMLNVSAGAAVSVTSEGKLSYSNVTVAGVYDIREMEMSVSPSDRNVFERALGLDGEDLLVDASFLSDRFLIAAEEDNDLVDLYSTNGEHLGLSVGDSIEIDIIKAGEPMQTLKQRIGTDIETYEELAELIEDSLVIESGAGVEIQSNGALYIVGDPGEANSLDSITISESGNSVLSDALSFNTIQEAKDAITTSSVVTYDSLGNTHTVILTFKKSEIDNYWTWEASLDTEASLLRGGTGSISFNSDGSLASFASDDGAPLTYEPNTGAETVIVAFDAGTLGELDGISQFSAASTVVASNQDGYGKGDLASITIDEMGVITGHYTNSISKTLAQIFLATFNNPTGLTKEGDNLYAEAANSGDAVIGTAGAPISASIISGGLEQSNVDLAAEFTDLITTQRGFQASTRVITTSDEMLVETVNLKR